MRIFVLTTNYELRVSSKSHLRDHPHLQAALSLSGTFLAFGLVLLLFLPVIFFILPETKGRHQLLDRVMRFSNIIALSSLLLLELTKYSYRIKKNARLLSPPIDESLLVQNVDPVGFSSFVITCYTKVEYQHFFVGLL
jgi:hypothetical protein